jgi:hypothetical protein
MHDVNTLSDRLLLEMITEDSTAWPQGWFLFTSSTHEPLSSPLLSHPAGTRDLHAGHFDLVDQGLIVDQPTPSMFAVRPNANITTSMVQILAGLPIVVNVVPAAYVLHSKEGIGWPAGTNRMRIFNELAAMIGYTDLYFDNAGVGQSHPFPDALTTDQADVLDYSSPPRIYRPTLVFSDDLLQLPNKFIVIGSGASGANVVGSYSVPASAPHSAANRGYVVAHSEQLQGIETKIQATIAATRIAREFRFAVQTVDFSGPHDPRHDHYNTLEIEAVRFLEGAWTMTLNEGSAMRHTAYQTYPPEELV